MSLFHFLLVNTVLHWGYEENGLVKDECVSKSSKMCVSRTTTEAVFIQTTYLS